MFWISLAAIVICTLMFKLGVLVTIVSLMAIGFKAVCVLILSGLFLWRWYKSRRVIWRQK
jgi:hypothetical protein